MGRSSSMQYLKAPREGLEPETQQLTAASRTADNWLNEIVLAIEFGTCRIEAFLIL